ncbi:MAG: UDP-3-O-(3-hydroxymyristoyl)glucosamine N-acyltransferase [bacterium]|nr:UDP-3-O-(3-hydroxymyristoyl)glucosamine N-acyltransferase [bacterium]
MLSFTLGEIAAQLGAHVVGDANVKITGLSGIAEAKAGDITFLAHPKYKSQVESSQATAIMVGPDVEIEGRNVIQVENPRLAFARLMWIAFPRKQEVPGIRPQAIVGEGAQVAGSATIYDGAHVGPKAKIGERSVIYPGCYVGEGVEIGEDCLIYANVAVLEGTKIGNRVVVSSGTVIGSEGFGYERDGDRHYKIPQVGGVIIEDDVEIGALCAIDKGSIRATILGQGTKLDNLIHIAHNCVLGENNLVLSQAGLAGSVKTGQNVYFAGQTGCMDHMKIVDFAQIGGRAVVTNDITEAGLYFGYPARPHAEWQKASVTFYKTPEMNKRIAELERKVEQLSAKLEGKEG